MHKLFRQLIITALLSVLGLIFILYIEKFVGFAMLLLSAISILPLAKTIRKEMQKNYFRENPTEKGSDLYAIDNARSGEQAQVMTEAEKIKKCVFCDINFDNNKPLNRQGKFDPEGKDWPLLWVWENPFPQEHQSHHIMIIPRRHIENETWDDITKAEWLQILDAWKWAQKFYNLPGGGFAGRFGPFKYNEGTVRHLHFQLQIPDLSGNVKVTLSKDRSPIEEARRANRKVSNEESYEGFIITNAYGHALDDKFRWVENWQKRNVFVHTKAAIPHIIKMFEGKNVVNPAEIAKATFVKGVGCLDIDSFHSISSDIQ